MVYNKMKILWLLYVLTGLGAFGVSLTLENFVFYKITGNSLFSYFIVIVFEITKILTIIIHAN